MREKLRAGILIAWSLCLGIWLAVGAGLTNPPRPTPPALSYRVEARPDSGFTVELRVSGGKARRPEFRLLDGWGLLQDQSDHILGIHAFDETGALLPMRRRREQGETRWSVDRRPKGDLTLRYRVAPYDPGLSPESSFTLRDRFMLLGYSAFLVPAGLSTFDAAPIEVRVLAPREWPVWASWRGQHRRFRPDTVHDLWSGVAAGGAFRPSRVQAGPVAVTVLTEAPIPELIGLSVANRLFPALREMVTLFGAPPRGDSLSVLAAYRAAAPRGSVSMLSGCSEEGAFLCLATPDRFRDVDELTALAVHECLHFYLGGAVSADGEPPYRNSPELVWLMEGVTEYLTYRLLEEAGSLPRGETDRVARRKEREMLAADVPGISLAEAARRMEDIETYTLVYSRGFLVARLLQRAMDGTAPGSFDAALRELFRTRNFYATRSTVTPDEVRGVFEAHAPGIGATLDRYAIGADPIPHFAEEGETGETPPAGKGASGAG